MAACYNLFEELLHVLQLYNYKHLQADIGAQLVNLISEIKEHLQVQNSDP